MKITKYILAIIATASIVGASGQNASKPGKIYIIDGYFFREIPMDKNMICGLLSIKTANGTRAYGLILQDELPADALKYAIPADSVAEADILLEQFNEKKSGAIRLTMSKEEALKVGDKFPPFNAVDIEGKKWSNADTEGKVMVLNCWFTGCGPCRAEMPELSEWKNEMPDVMFFSSTYERPETARPVLEKQQFNWIPLVNDTIFKNYIGSNGYPMTVVVDKDGIIRQVEFGTTPLQREKLKQTIQSLR